MLGEEISATDKEISGEKSEPDHDQGTYDKTFADSKTMAADIARELRQHPDRWMQRRLVRFRNGLTSNDQDEVSREDAVCWCLRGHILKRIGPDTRFIEVDEHFRAALGRRVFISEWNDAKDRTVAEVIELCERLAAA
jgi:hypothetical protein